MNLQKSRIMKFENIYKETEENLRLALLSMWAPGSHPMRPAIEKLFKEEPLLAEPVFQSMFGWKATTDPNWRNYLNADVISKLEIGQKYLPYSHQSESWKKLQEGKSIVVTSGTGSGKTECFMYPVLSDLYEQPKSNAIQAIFLYPLNALMEDQKARLANFCEKTDLKFAVYNGNTPDFKESGADGEHSPNEVVTRELIRDNKGNGTRPQILLSNPSMLEYVLVRKSDQKMLQESAGKLRWIIIDEAHSYSGSSAVELAYQIKRILDAFGVKANEVRFACTSATIGGQDGVSSLIDYISMVTGQDKSNIAVIDGERLVPAIDRNDLETALAEKHIHVSADKLIALRNKINTVAGMSLRQIWDWFGPQEYYTPLGALNLIDRLCELKAGGKVVMSLRAHFFMRAISGLYACANENCHGTSGTQYGHLTTYKAAVCPYCGKPLLELVQCKRCNSFVLMGVSDAQTHVVTPYEDGFNHDDYFAINNDEDLDDSSESERADRPDVFYLLPYDKEKNYTHMDKANVSTMDLIHTEASTKLELMVNKSGHWIEYRDGQKTYCPTCGRLAKGKKLNFNHFRIPINFINQTVSPVFLKECAPADHSWGKYIAFTDSRQGTAISAKTFNIEVERRIARKKVMEELAKAKANASNPTLTRESLIAMHLDDVTINAILSQIAAPTATNKHLTLSETADLICYDRLFDHISSPDTGDKRAYKASLIRSFIGRRQLYETGVESMGLVTLVYPALKDVHMPESLQDFSDDHELGLTDKDWQDYLKIILDFHIRLANHIQPLIPGERKYVRDSNLSKPIAPADDEREGVSKWVKVKKDDQGNVSVKQPRVVLLLCAALGIDSQEKLTSHARLVDNLLSDAWNTLVEKHLLVKVTSDSHEGYNDPKFYSDGRYLGCYYVDLSGTDTNDTAFIKKTEKVWECPVSGALLDTTVCGYSPIMTGELSAGLFKQFKCSDRPITMPSRPSSNDEVAKWQATDDTVHTFQEKGFWSDRYKYIYSRSTPDYLAAEHSAQQSKELLRKYTVDFKADNPIINVLHCSTTMEMGVDIGDIDVVLMDTVPPTAANYLQRVGRAGRNGQTKAVAFSLCNNTPVGQHAFANPMWALQATNHMAKARESQTIIQRHINSFFFRQFICDNGSGIQATITIKEFMESLCDAFVDFLDDMSTNQAEIKKFAKIFGAQTPFTIDVTIQAIRDIQKDYNDVIKELEDALEKYQDEEKRKRAITIQIEKTQREGLLKYLSEKQFIPNASMPTGVVSFEFIDREQSSELVRCYKRSKEITMKIKESSSDSEKEILRSELNKIEKKIKAIQRSTTASREVYTALNEYAPEQTVVVNEKNYVSAGVKLLGAYNEATQTKAIYFCKNCGHTEYKVLQQTDSKCPICQSSYRSIVDPEGRSGLSYTLAYEPIGFCTDQNADSSREERTEKKFYDIRPVLLRTNWAHPMKLNMCEVSSSGEQGEILFYNVGNGAGFAFCKRCGRAAVEKDSYSNEVPSGVHIGHNRLWGDTCEAAESDIARHVVFTGRHQTCYSVLRFKKSSSASTFECDERLAYSMGVILRRALAEYLGIDEGEIGFGTKPEQEDTALFIFDTARGGCGYSLHLSRESECQEVFKIAKRMITSSTCSCEQEDGACAKCLVDRENYRNSRLLSKALVLEWLRRQSSSNVVVTESVQNFGVDPHPVFQPLRSVAKSFVNSSDCRKLIFCVSDTADNCAINDWGSVHTQIGRLVKKAVEKGKTVEIKVEYHPDVHPSNADKLQFVSLADRFPDCKVDFVKDLGTYKTGLIAYLGADRVDRYFTEEENALSFSESWGMESGSLFFDHTETAFGILPAPVLENDSSEIVRSGTAKANSFRVAHYFSDVIEPVTLSPGDQSVLKSILSNKKVRITFSDKYVNSALASLMLVYLIKEVRDTYNLDIQGVTLRLDSSRRFCSNNKFGDYTYINLNFETPESADEYTEGLFEDVLGVVPFRSHIDAGHHRWLRFETEDGKILEIRPDHGISGGWKSSSKYMNLDSLGGMTEAFREGGDVLYYVIIKK